MSLNYVTSERTVIPTQVYSDPYMRAEIEQIDHNYNQFHSLKGWKRQYPCTAALWDGYTLTTLNPKSAYSSVNLTRTFTITSEGWYHIYFHVKRGPTHRGKARLYINDELIDEPYEAYHTIYHWKLVDFGLVYLNTGKNYFKINIDKNVGVGQFFLYKIVKHDSNNITDYARKLDIQSLKFTQNSVNEFNTLSMPVTLKEEYYDDESPSRFVFDGLTNRITLWMGQEYKDATAMFGGPIVSLKDSEDGILTIGAVDSLFDLYREPVYRNFEVNTSVKTDDSKLFPYSHKHNIFEVIRYLAETNEEGFDCSGLEYPQVFYWDFGDKKEFDRLQVSGYTKKWDQKNGHPKPGLRLGVGKRAGLAKVILWDNPEEPFDANIHNIFAFNYMYSPKSAKYATEMHFAIDMYREGETAADAVTYHILFNSKEGSTNVIGKFNPTFNGKWNTGKFNIRDAFDKYAPSSAYYVTGVRIEDSLSTTQVKNRANSGIWLDNITCYDEDRNIKTTIDQEASYTFDIFQRICEDNDFSLYVDYGNTRREDVLVLRSNYDDVAEIQAMPSNIIKIGEVSYDMKSHDVRNFAKRMYHPTVTEKKKVAHVVKNKPSKKKYQVKYVTENGKKVKEYVYYTYKDEKVKKNLSDLDYVLSSYGRYRKWENFKDLTDVTKKVDAETDATKYLNEHNIAPYGFTLTLNGTTLLKPNQYMLVDEDKRHLSGVYPIKSMIHNYKNNEWTQDIDLGIASKRFRRIVFNMRRNLGLLNNRYAHTTYTSNQINDLSSTGLRVLI